MKRGPLRYLFDHTRDNGDRVDYFRHEDGRCIAVIDARLTLAGGEEIGSSPYPVPTFERIEVNGKRIFRDDAVVLDELTDVIVDALRGFDWEAPMPYRGAL